MNIALSHAGAAGRPSFGARRHPVGVTVVIGLHVLVAGALLTARTLHAPSVESSDVTVIPDPVRPPPIVRTDDALPPPPDHPPVIYAEPPKFVVDPVVDPVTTSDRKPVVAPETHVDDRHGEEHVAIAEPTRFKPHAGSVNASAAQCRPDYPAAAARAGATGVSHLRFTIDASGKVTNAQILQPAGPTREHRLLDQAAAAALAQCPIAVGTDEAGHAVASTADVEYVWTLN